MQKKCGLLIAAGASLAIPLLIYSNWRYVKRHFASCPLKVSEYISVQLSEAIPMSHNTRLLRFKLPSARDALNLPIASAIYTKYTQATTGKDVVRPYTPIADEVGHFDLLVKHYPNGPMSTHLFDLKPGDSLLIRGPISKIPYTANMKKQIGMIAGGTGITPMLQIIKKIADDQEDKTQVTLLFGNLSEADIILRQQLDSIAAAHPNITVHYLVDQSSSSAEPSDRPLFTGRVSCELVKSLMPVPSKDSLLLVCGPAGMISAVCGEKGPNYSQGEVKGILKECGYSQQHVYKF